jgi:hypothetical protein
MATAGTAAETTDLVVGRLRNFGIDLDAVADRQTR